ncbi:hypothetical protein A1O7_08608 [Cladophialophora yegresii CBS 114405]|uniref:Large ribosomal subunit protein mL67 n=1 Tax=Cladophialophora yegresii CBS 114405 TaxID=1182544 RepID=W9WAU6_9EURO|nr:uncharacterized protein A1O7_08608 [Cladophialophora yegresii CBS 114405]EXJ55679.1 hypothetical protein A1O7_08608 [Cladophialophora yegresii CBS 114405]
MAATAASAMAHQMPPMAIPAMPRIRPPRLLKGEPHPNNAPMPPVSPNHPSAKWVQGKWRTGNSKAVKNKRATQDIQVAKALRHQTHGLDIYAYRHIRTNQVVYSLTRTLQENKVLTQLLYHGKKTVPSSVRNDMWTPYFSIHFPPTPAGALEGLFAFQKLRELSTQRQLSPPENLIRATQEDIDVVKSKLGSPTTLQEMAARDELQGKIPKLNEILPKKLRAQKLMDQKATSVADAAFVLDWILSGPSPWERVTTVAKKRAIKASESSGRTVARLGKVRKEIEQKAAEIRRRASLAVESLADGDRASLRLTFDAIHQLSMEHRSIISEKGDKLDDPDTQLSVDLDNLREFEPAGTKVKVNRKEPLALQRQQRRATLAAENNAFKERIQTAKYAEHEAIKDWFQHNETPSTETGSLWESVSLARENALDTYDTQQKMSKLAAAGEVETGSKPDNTPKTETVQSSLSALKPDWATEPRSVKMYWADVNDGLFASSWPRNVVHGSLAPFGVAKAWTWAPHLDEAGSLITDSPRVKVAKVVGKSVHVMGSSLDDGWVTEEMLQGGKRPPVWAEPPPPPPVPQEDVQVEYQRLDESATSPRRDPAVFHDEDIVVEERRQGLWARVRRMFGR